MSERTNPENLDRLVEELQEMVLKDARATYSPQVVEEWLQPQNIGRMSQPDASAARRGTCGDTMEFYLDIRDGVICRATFMTDGCGPTIACGSWLSRLVTGLDPDEAREISAELLLEQLGGLPEESVHCAHLAVDTLQQAIASYGQADENQFTMTSSGAPMASRDQRELEAIARQAGDLMRQGFH